LTAESASHAETTRRLEAEVRRLGPEKGRLEAEMQTLKSESTQVDERAAELARCKQETKEWRARFEALEESLKGVLRM